MASKGNIKGITVELNGETKGLDAALKQVNKQAGTLRQELKEVETSLRFNPGNVELLEQQQAKLGDQIAVTSDKLDALKGAYKEAEAQLGRGEIDQGQFDKLQREIIKAENQLSTFETKMEEVSSTLDMSDAEKEFDRINKAMLESGEASKKLQSELNNVEKALKMDPGNADLIAQQQRVIGEMSNEASKRVGMLEESFKELENTADGSELGASQFDELKREVIMSEKQLEGFDNTLKQINDSLNMSSSVKEFERITLALQASDKEADQLKTALKEVEQALELDPGNVTLLEQQQRLFAEQVDVTSNRLKLMEDSYHDLESAAANGDLGVDKLDKLNVEIVKTTSELKTFENTLNGIDENSNMSTAEREFDRITQAMKESDAAAGKLQSELKEVEEALNLDPGNADLIAQKQRVIGEMANESRQRLDMLSGSFQELEAAAQRGELGADKFDKLKREIITTEKRVEGLDQGITELGANTGTDKAVKGMDGLREAADKAEGAIGGIGGALAGLGVGFSVGGLVDSAMNMASLNNQIERATGLTGEQRDQVRGLIKDVDAYGVDAGEALEGVRRQWALNKDASAEANSEIVKQAAVMSQTYAGIDFTELIQELNEISGELEISDQEALALADSLLSVGFPPEQIDTIAEYGKQLTDAGFAADEIRGIMASAAATDSWNIDNLLDGLKEGRIRAVEMGAGLSDSFKESIREVTGGTKAMSEEQIAQLEKTLDAQQDAREKALSEELNALEEQNDKLESQKQKTLDNQLKAVEKNLESQQKSLDKAHDNEIEKIEDSADARLKSLEESNEAEYKAVEKSINRKQDALQKSHDSEIKKIEERAEAQVKALDKTHDKQIEAARDRADAAVKVLEEQQDKQQKILEKNIDKQQKALEQSQRKELKDAEELADAKIKLIDKEYTERLKLVDEEKYNAIKSVEDEIKGIEDRMAADAKAIEEEETARRRRELQTRILQAETAEEYRDAQQALTDFDLDQERKKIEERRRGQIESLKERKDGIKEEFDAKISSIKEEEQAALESAKNVNSANMDALKERQADAKDMLSQESQNRLDNLRNEQQQAKELQSKQQESLLEGIQARHEREKENIEKVNESQLESIRFRQDRESEALNEASENTLNNLRDRQEREVESIEQTKENQLEAIRERQEREKEAFAERKESQLENIREANEADLASFTALNDKKEEDLALAHETEMARLDEINQKKLDAAMSPPETKLYQDTIEQLELWGQAIAEGGEKGSEAYRDMVEWLGNIEDDTLRNMIGTELFGTMWEDQGDNIVDTLMGMDDHMSISGDNIENLQDKVNNMDNDPIVKMNDALNDMMGELAPLLTEIANFVGEFAGWISENKGLVLSIGTIVGALVGVGGVLAAINTIKGAFSLLGPFLGALFKTGPIGLAISVLIGLVTLIILNWEPLKEFFSGLWDDISSGFTSFKDGFADGFQNIKDTASRIWDEVKNIFKDDGEMERNGEDAGNGFLKGLWSKGKDIWNAAKEIGGGVWKSIKNKLKIKSPSRVMMDLGEFAGEGLAIGVESMSNRVNKASTKLATNVVPDIPDVDVGGINTSGSRRGGSSNGSADGGGTVALHFHGDMNIRNDQDITELARQLEELISRKARGRG